MPVILSYGGKTESGLQYDDQFGEHYTYPLRYQKIIQKGELAIFYRGRRDHTDGYKFARYVGYGLIGNIEKAEPTHDGKPLLRCRTIEVKLFAEPLPLTDENGSYYEYSANSHNKPPLWFSNGVRKITTTEYAKIMKSAGIRQS